MSLLALLLCGGAVLAIFTTEPEAKRSGATKKTAMLVDVIVAEHGSYHPTLVVTGTVRAEKDVQLSSRVGGAIVERSEAFSPGNLVEKGTRLLQIDPTNYRIALAQQKSALEQAKTSLHLELGRQRIAQQEYESVFEGEVNDTEKDLILRKPQLISAQEQVTTKEADVEQARVDLARTAILAPFDAQVLAREVDVGAHVQPGRAVGRLVGVEMYWVEASVPLGLRRWLQITQGKSEDDAPCREAILTNRGSWPADATRKGCLTRLIGAVDENTRMARVLIEVNDPLALDPERKDAGPALVVGEFLEARIEGIQLDGVVRVPREFVRKKDTVWLARQEKLHIAELEVLLFDADYAYVDEGLEEGDRIVTTHLSTVTEGATLRFDGDGDG